MEELVRTNRGDTGFSKVPPDVKVIRKTVMEGGLKRDPHSDWKPSGPSLLAAAVLLLSLFPPRCQLISAHFCW